MPKISDLLAETGTTEVIVGGSTVKIVYRQLWASRLEGTDWEEARSLAPRDYFSRVIPNMVTSWDLQDDEGRELPVTADVILVHNLPTDFLHMVENAVIEAGQMGKSRNGTSRAS